MDLKAICDVEIPTAKTLGVATDDNVDVDLHAWQAQAVGVLQWAKSTVRKHPRSCAAKLSAQGVNVMRELAHRQVVLVELVRELMRSQHALRVVEPQQAEPVAVAEPSEGERLQRLHDDDGAAAEAARQDEPLPPARRVHRRKTAQAETVQP